MNPMLSVLMSVYDNEKPEFLAQSLQSLQLQTYEADEIVLVEDGPLKRSLSDVIEAYALRLPIVSVKLPANVGLGAALACGLEICRGELIARVDSDDICLPDRFKRQMDWLCVHPGVDLLGGAYAEFEPNGPKLHLVRRVPEGGRALARYAKSRTPFNHTTVMFRKSSVLAVGGYETAKGFEDYLLGARMLMKRCNLRNLEDVLVYVRADRGFIRRRGGIQYAKDEIAFQWRLQKMGFLTIVQCLRNVILRTPVRLLPGSVRSILYRRFLRSAPSHFFEAEPNA
jgi:glycosyltransferase involved in cell wall biosynthesis